MVGAVNVERIQMVNEPEIKTPLRKFVETLITLCVWAIWICLFLPVVRMEAASPERMYYSEFFRNLFYFAIISAVVFFSWSYYNLLRFRGNNRRRDCKTVRDNNVKIIFDITSQEFEMMKGGDVLVWCKSREKSIPHAPHYF